MNQFGERLVGHFKPMPNDVASNAIMVRAGSWRIF